MLSGGVYSDSHAQDLDALDILLDGTTEVPEGFVFTVERQFLCGQFFDSSFAVQDLVHLADHPRADLLRVLAVAETALPRGVDGSAIAGLEAAEVGEGLGAAVEETGDGAVFFEFFSLYHQRLFVGRRQVRQSAQLQCLQVRRLSSVGAFLLLWLVRR